MVDKMRILREIDFEALWWPTAGELAGRHTLAGNQVYEDLTWLSWKDVARLLDLEKSFIERIDSSASPSEEMTAIEDELYEDPEGLLRLDLGVAACVASLSAMGCIPSSSCNGGAFGGYHLEAYPLVTFLADRASARRVLKIAERAGLGLRQDDGYLVLYSDDARKFLSFSAIALDNADI
ncbi:hypothetical protein [Rhizobium sp. CECT 9324]|uniref:hypothetical protein n=1 Tax=Rhizobium sp. CECT 9324 TaxID=2845820 RepID=UPI001E63E954|nr:hypothetical protein [Rhizobium sp. CECT 9324]